MNTLLMQASDALSRNDANTLEELFDRVTAPKPDIQTEAERASYHAALLVFRRQVIAARGNIILRKRLLAGHTPEVSPWVP